MRAGGWSSTSGAVTSMPRRVELIGTAEDEAQLETLKDVVGRHLIRFGANDELVVSWTPEAN